jgi:protein SCO1/2
MNNFRFVFILVTLSLLLLGCNEKVDRVRVIGEKIIVRQNENGKIFYDTIATTAPSFCFKNQDTRLYCNADLKGKVYLVDFFFTHCPSICVKMKRNMLTIQNEFKNQDRFAITSFTIDPARDSASVLASYAAKLGVDTKQWSFLTGNRDSIYATANRFLAEAAEDENSPGGFIHDGNFILVDPKGRIRGYYDGVDEKEMPRLIKDIKSLLHE